MPTKYQWLPHNSHSQSGWPQEGIRLSPYFTTEHFNQTYNQTAGQPTPINYSAIDPQTNMASFNQEQFKIV